MRRRAATRATAGMPVRPPATTPAALSDRIGDELLRRRLSFEGLVVTPPLTAEFLRRVPSLSPGEVAVQAVLAYYRSKQGN